MSDESTRSVWIDRLNENPDSAVLNKLWSEYFQRLVGLARVRLRGASRRVADEEDVALSAIHSFCRNAELGRFPDLSSRDDLWRLLGTIVSRKAFDHSRRERRLKRGGGEVRGDSAVLGTDEAGKLGNWNEVVGNEPTPEFVARSGEEYGQLLDLLGDDELREIAVSKMEGFTNEEIASRRGCAVPTVERRLRLIRKTWSAQIGEKVE
jgi:DNA-directed RNA polymerase specialized sigma24 family protein